MPPGRGRQAGTAPGCWQMLPLLAMPTARGLGRLAPSMWLADLSSCPSGGLSGWQRQAATWGFSSRCLSSGCLSAWASAAERAAASEPPCQLVPLSTAGTGTSSGLPPPRGCSHPGISSLQFCNNSLSCQTSPPSPALDFGLPQSAAALGAGLGLEASGQRGNVDTGSGPVLGVNCPATHCSQLATAGQATRVAGVL